MLLTYIKPMSLSGQTLVFVRSKACVCLVKRKCSEGVAELWYSFISEEGDGQGVFGRTPCCGYHSSGSVNNCDSLSQNSIML